MPYSDATSTVSVGLESWHVEPMIEFRAAFDELPGNVHGLPIGPEASAVLGTIGLHSVDRLLVSLEHFRLVDDVWLVAETEREAMSWATRFAGHLHDLGMAENECKRQIVNGVDALDAISDSDIDYATCSGAPISVDTAIDLLRSAIDHQMPGRLRFALAVLSHDPAGTAVPVVLAHLDLLDVEPVGVGRYLRSVATALSVDDAATQVTTGWLVASTSRAL
jgi:hypothetical protein